MAISKHSKSFPVSKHMIRIFLDVLFFLCVTLPALYMFVQAAPYERGFFCDDPSLSYPYKPDTVPNSVLIAAGFAISILVVVIVEVLICADGRCRNSCFNADGFIFCLKSYAVFLVGLVMQLLLVEVVKNTMGIQRPNFFDVCRPAFNTSLCPGYISKYTCTGNYEGEIRSSRQSFPSGHSSFSMYIAAYLCIHIQKRLKITFSTVLKFLFQSCLVFISLLCGLGRITDNKHRPIDVIVGFLVGIIVAASVYVFIGKSLFELKTSSYSTSTPLPISKCCGACCESCDQTPEAEPQTPSPLLDNEFLNSVSSVQSRTKPTFLTDIPFYVRRHCSTPVTPSGRIEEI